MVDYGGVTKLGEVPNFGGGNTVPSDVGQRYARGEHLVNGGRNIDKATFNNDLEHGMYQDDDMEDGAYVEDDFELGLFDEESYDDEMNDGAYEEEEAWE